MGKSKYFFPFFSLCVIFADELFYGLLTITGTSLESGMKSREAIIIAAIAYSLMIGDTIKGRLSRKNYLQIIALIIILTCYLATSYLYTNSNSGYWAHLLVYGSLCVPACYVGMRLARGNYGDKILRLLPWFVAIVSIISFRAVFTSSSQGGLLGWNERDVFNYQNASYYLSFCYSYCFFYICIVKSRKNKTFTDKLGYWLLMLLLFVCAIGCLLGGGRGAFLYLLAITAYLVYRIINRKGENKTSNLFFIIGGVILMFLMLNQFHVLDSVGFSRVSENLMTDDIRKEFQEKAIRAFNQSPIIGNGIGSIWWTVGFYSHNILFDLLAETGVIGTAVIIFILIKCVVKQAKLSNSSFFDMFMLILFLGSLVEGSFSGYWISSCKLFLMFGYTFAVVKKRNDTQIKGKRIGY